MAYQTNPLFYASGSGKRVRGNCLAAIPGFFSAARGDEFQAPDLQINVGRAFWKALGNLRGIVARQARVDTTRSQIATLIDIPAFVESIFNPQTDQEQSKF